MYFLQIELKSRKPKTTLNLGEREYFWRLQGVICPYSHPQEPFAANHHCCLLNIGTVASWTENSTSGLNFKFQRARRCSDELTSSWTFSYDSKIFFSSSHLANNKRELCYFLCLVLKFFFRRWTVAITS